MKFKTANRSGGMVVELNPGESPSALLTAPSAFKLRKILVPVDFSECSLKALQYALPFAKQFGAEIVLVHVVQSYLPVPEMATVDVALIQSQLRESAEKELNKLQKKVDPDLTTKALLRMGNPYMEVVAVARETGADLIILSTHGRTGLAHVFLGSIAENIVRHAGCPVLVVRENEHEFVDAAS